MPQSPGGVAVAESGARAQRTESGRCLRTPPTEQTRGWCQAGGASSSGRTRAIDAPACRHGVTTVRTAPRSRDGSQRGWPCIDRLAHRVERAALAVLRRLRVPLRDLGARAGRTVCRAARAEKLRGAISRWFGRADFSGKKITVSSSMVNSSRFRFFAPVR